MIQYLPPAAQRVRLTIRNWNPRYVFADQRAVALTEVKIGRHTGDGRGTGWVELPAGATAYDSGWTDVPASLRGAEIVLQYRWEGRDVVRCLGTGWTDGVRDPFPPLFSWLEVEVPTSTPVVAVFGSSTAAGVGAERPLIDSWFGLWAREHGVVPMFVAHSGDKALAWSSVSDRKWSLYGDEAVPVDAVLYAMGSNYWAERVSLAVLQHRVETTIGGIRLRTDAPIFGTTITPRRRRPPNEQTRIAYNEWLRESGLFAGVIDLAAAVSLPDGTLDPGRGSRRHPREPSGTCTARGSGPALGDACGCVSVLQAGTQEAVPSPPIGDHRAGGRPPSGARGRPPRGRAARAPRCPARSSMELP